MPLPADSFDIVVSSMAIHNIRDPHERVRAIDEAVRVLRRGGRLLVVDLGHVCGSYIIYSDSKSSV
jgi:ubiquinone/menaquinone biosynthesis C-methylase UbiE